MELEFLIDQDTAFMGGVKKGQKETLEKSLGELLITRGICKELKPKNPAKPKAKNV